VFPMPIPRALWCVEHHGGGLIGFEGPDYNVLVVFTSQEIAEDWIMESNLEQHLASGPYAGKAFYELCKDAVEDFSYYAVNPPPNPGDHLPAASLEALVDYGNQFVKRGTN
jgi:hypothetical protein